MAHPAAQVEVRAQVQSRSRLQVSRDPAFPDLVHVSTQLGDYGYVTVTLTWREAARLADNLRIEANAARDDVEAAVLAGGLT